MLEKGSYNTLDRRVLGEGNTIRASFTVSQSSVSVRVGLATFTKGPPCGVFDTIPPSVAITRPAAGGTITHTHSNRLAYTIQDDHSVAQVQVVFTDENNVEINSFFSCVGPDVPPLLGVSRI